MAESSPNGLRQIAELLRGKPLEFYNVVATRAALRILPLVVEFEQYRGLEKADKERVYLATFRAAQACWTSIRYPSSLAQTKMVDAGRALSRIAGQTATRVGDNVVVKVGYAVADAALSVAQGDVQLALRSIENSIGIATGALTSAGTTLSQQIADDIVRLITSRNQSSAVDVQLLVSRKLWRSGRPSWATEASSRLSIRLKRRNGEASFWSEWYAARVRGAREFDLSLGAVETINVDLANRDSSWWASSYDFVEERIEKLVSEAVNAKGADHVTIAEFIVSKIESNPEPMSIQDLLATFEAANYPVVRKTVRGELSRLAAARRIRRVDIGRYGRVSATEYAEPQGLGPIEPQTRGAIQFEAQGRALITVKRRASAGEIRIDESAARRHREVIRRADNLLSNASRTDAGANTSAKLLHDIEMMREALGEEVSKVDPDLLIPRGDGLRSDLTAQRTRDDFSNLPPLPDALLVELEKLVASYNYYVSLDPELAKRDEALLGPDARKKLVPPREGQAVISDAVKRHAAASEVIEVLGEESQVAPEIPDPESRQSRRYSEGAKNFARIAVERGAEFANLAWRHKVKIATSFGATYGAAQWVLANKAWLLNYFSENTVMVRIIEKLLEILQKLPLS